MQHVCIRFWAVVFMNEHFRTVQLDATLVQYIINNMKLQLALIVTRILPPTCGVLDLSYESSDVFIHDISSVLVSEEKCLPQFLYIHVPTSPPSFSVYCYFMAFT